MERDRQRHRETESRDGERDMEKQTQTDTEKAETDRYRERELNKNGLLKLESLHPSDTPLPTRPRLLSLPKLLHQLETVWSNMGARGGCSHSDHHRRQEACFSFLTSVCLSPLGPQ